MTCLLQYSTFLFSHKRFSLTLFFFSTTLVVLYHSTHKNLIIKVLDSIPHPLNLNLFGEMLTLALAEDSDKSHRCPANCTFTKLKTKIGPTIIAKTFQLPYTALTLLPLKLQKIDCATRAFNKFTVLRGGTFVFSQ